MSLRRIVSCSVIASALSICAGPSAAASPLFELVGASTGTGGFNARATGGSSASTYFNPALLPHASQSFEVGLLIVSDQISMTLDGRTGGIVPDVVGDRQIIDGAGNPIPNSTVPTDWLEHGCSLAQCGAPPFAARPRQARGSSGNTRAYTVIGLVDYLVRDRLVLGFYALVPIGDFTAAHSFYNDEREQFFTNSLHPEMYSDRLLATSLSFGLGLKVVDRLSVGGSFTLGLTNIAQASTYVRDPIDYDKLLISNDIRVETAISPHFGVVYDALDSLHLSATAHSEQRFTIDTGIKATLPAGNESGTTRSEVHSFLPWTFGLGAALDLNRGARHAFTVVGNIRYALWSDYLDRHAESPGAQGKDFEFKNVFSETVGVRHRTGPVETFLDVNFQPTPVPLQTGRSNYVDNDRLGALVGMGYGLSLFGLPFRIGVQAQAQRLLPRYQAKNDRLIVDELPDDAVDSRTGSAILGAGGLQTNNPGWPGFASDGWILGGAATVALIY
jgi:long-chain fatty acid transport protein